MMYLIEQKQCVENIAAEGEKMDFVQFSMQHLTFQLCTFSGEKKNMIQIIHI